MLEQVDNAADPQYVRGALRRRPAESSRLRETADSRQIHPLGVVFLLEQMIMQRTRKYLFPFTKTYLFINIGVVLF